MRKIISLILLAVCCILTGCGNSVLESTDNMSVNNTNPDLYVTIYVNNEIIDTDYPCSYNPEGRNAEIPLLTVLRELGATVSTKNPKKVKISYNDKSVVLYPEIDNFGIAIPPGTSNAVRTVYNGELIVDSGSASTLLRALFSATISVDYETLSVHIEQQGND